MIVRTKEMCSLVESNCQNGWRSERGFVYLRRKYIYLRRKYKKTKIWYYKISQTVTMFQMVQR